MQGGQIPLWVKNEVSQMPSEKEKEKSHGAYLNELLTQFIKKVYWVKYRKWRTQMSQIPLEVKNDKSQKALLDKE